MCCFNIIQIKQGATRCVILTKSLVFKLPVTFYKKPSPYRGFWYRLLIGLLANIQEKDFNNVQGICPIPFAKILFYVPGGWLVVMKRGRPITPKEFSKIQRLTLPSIVENKIDSFVMIDGEIQVVDYGS